MATKEPRNEIGRDEKAETDEEEKWVAHYSSNHQILLVGEGDFSFSLSLANSFGSASNICASSKDSYDVLIKKYKQVKSNLENLEKLGAFLLHEVDATKMKLHSDLAKRKFDRIIFNFPHAGFYGKEDDVHLIQMHRDLVQGFFRNAGGMLRANGEIHVNHKNNAPFCCWNLEELASRSSLALTDQVRFRKEDYPGYQNKRGNGSRCDEPFPLYESITFKFRFSHRAEVPKETTSLGSIYKSSRQFQNIPMEMLLHQTTSDFNYLTRTHITSHIPAHVGLPSTIPISNHYSRVSDTNLNGFALVYQRNHHAEAYSVPERMRSDFDANSNGFIPTYQMNHHDEAHSDPQRMRSGFDANLNGFVSRYQRIHHAEDYSVLDRMRSYFDANLNGFVSRYQRNHHAEAHSVSERMRSYFDANLNGFVPTYQRNYHAEPHSILEIMRFDFDESYCDLGGMRHGLERQMEVPRTMNGGLYYMHELPRISMLRSRLQSALAESHAYQLDAPNMREMPRW